MASLAVLNLPSEPLPTSLKSFSWILDQSEPQLPSKELAEWIVNQNPNVIVDYVFKCSRLRVCVYKKWGISDFLFRLEQRWESQGSQLSVSDEYLWRFYWYSILAQHS